MSGRGVPRGLTLGALALPAMVGMRLPGVEIGDVDPVGAVIGMLSLLVAVYTLYLARRQGRTGGRSWWQRKAVRNSTIAVATVVAVLSAVKVISTLSTGDAGSSVSYFAGTPHCRQSIPVDDDGKHYAKINPCISIDSNNQVIIWGDYTAEVTGTFTVFVWLIDAENQDRAAGAYARCPVTFTYVGRRQTVPCKKSGITPPRSGKWEASMVVEPGTHQTPNLWNTRYKGTRSGSVTWHG